MPATATEIGSDALLINLEACIVPTYVSTTVFDPTAGTAVATDYTVVVDTNGRITIAAPEAELETISVTR